MENGLYSGSEETPGQVSSVGVPITLKDEFVRSRRLLSSDVLEDTSQLVVDVLAREQRFAAVGQFCENAASRP